MKVWLDAQLSPMIADWINKNYNVSCKAVREVGLKDAADRKYLMKPRKLMQSLLRKILISVSFSESLVHHLK